MSARLAVLVSCLSISSLAAGCGFHPLYGEIRGKPAAQAEFHSIYVDSIGSVQVGYELRNSLIGLLQAATKPDEAQYRLKVDASQGVEAIAVEPDATITRYDYQILVRYQLLDSRSGKLLTTGSESTQTAYDAVNSPYSTLVAQQDAARRSADDMALRIQLALAVYFHKTSK